LELLNIVILINLCWGLFPRVKSVFKPRLVGRASSTHLVSGCTVLAGLHMVWILIANWVSHSIRICSAELLSHTHSWHGRHCTCKLLLLWGGVGVHSCHNFSQLANYVVGFLLLAYLLWDLLLGLNWPLLLHHLRHLLHLRLLGLLHSFWWSHEIKKISLWRLRHGL